MKCHRLALNAFIFAQLLNNSAVFCSLNTGKSSLAELVEITSSRLESGSPGEEFTSYGPAPRLVLVRPALFFWSSSPEPLHLFRMALLWLCINKNFEGGLMSPLSLSGVLWKYAE